MICTHGALIAYAIKNKANQFMKAQFSNHEAVMLQFMTQSVNSLPYEEQSSKALMTNDPSVIISAFL